MADNMQQNAPQMNNGQPAGAKHISDADFQSVVDAAKGGGRPVVIDFYADWCGPCQMAAPIIDKLAGEYAGKVDIVKLNVDENMQTSQQFGVMSIPTVVVIKDGKEVDRKIGFPGEDEYRKLVDKSMAS